MTEERETGTVEPPRRQQREALRLVRARLSTGPPGDSPRLREVAEALRTWFVKSGRGFSWRATRDPYRVLIAEILLRKTGAAAVETFLPAFYAAYPAPEVVATARLDELVAFLAPLGLGLQRGQQLQDLGQRLVSDLGGRVPNSVEDLLSLPGTGAYTAAMVATTCFGARIPAVDTNVARVLCRVFGLIPSHFEARKSPNVWALAGELLSAWQGESAEFSWALLDLGALICTARQPRCPFCPLRTYCAFARSADGATSQGGIIPGRIIAETSEDFRAEVDDAGP